MFGLKEIALNDTNTIIINSSSNDSFILNEVTLVHGLERINIGFFYTHNYGCTKEWMEYSSNMIVLMIRFDYGQGDPICLVDKMFDIKSRCFIHGSQKELWKKYQKEFNGFQKKKLLFHNRKV